jgi:cbb3-type cytochrome oxidase maturation protein
MGSLWVLVPLSVGLVLLILLALAWAVSAGQFEDLEKQGLAILGADE